MTNEISKKLACVTIRNGVEIWIEHEKLATLERVLTSSNPPRFVQIGDEFVNLADVIGVFSASTVENTTRRKNGQWQCKQGTWHDQRTKCECRPASEIEYQRRREAAIKACGKCENGFIYNAGDTVVYCDCISQ